MQLHLNFIAALNSVLPILAFEALGGPDDADCEHSDDAVQYRVTVEEGVRILCATTGSTDTRISATIRGDSMELAVTGDPLPTELAHLSAALGLQFTPSGKNGLIASIEREAFLERLAVADAARLLLSRLREQSGNAAQAVKSAVTLLTFAHDWRNNRELALDTKEWIRRRAERDAKRLVEHAKGFKSWGVIGLESITLHHDPRGSCVEILLQDRHPMRLADARFEWPVGCLVGAAGSGAPSQHGTGKYAVRPSKVPAAVVGALSTALIEGNTVRLTRQLDSKLYKQVNEVLTELGGNWHTGQGAHVFDADPTARLLTLLATGTMFTSRDFEYFETQPTEVARLVRLADLRPGMRVGEPSAGRGAIAMACAEIVGRENVDVHELMPENAEHLQRLGFAIKAPTDFLSVEPAEIWDRICMNPPFSGGRDIVHVMHAIKFLRPGGILVAIMSPGWQSSSNARSTAFRAYLEEHSAKVEKIAAGAFKSVGTDVATVLVRIVKPGTAKQQGKAVTRVAAPSVSCQTELF